MPGQFSDSSRSVESGQTAASSAVPLIGATRSGTKRSRRKDWRQGGRAVRKWNHNVLAVAFLGMGVGVLGAGLVGNLLPVLPIASTLALWVGLVAATVFAFTRARPAGLMRIRPTDVLWGLCFGLSLRLIQGWVSGADSVAFPSAAGARDPLGQSWWLTDFLFAGLLGPAVEEFFFRAVLLVATYEVLRRGLGNIAAAVTALLTSAGVFVLLHGLSSALTFGDGVMLFLVGAVSASVVLLTGRLWGAIVLHITFNVSFLALVFLGTALR